MRGGGKGRSHYKMLYVAYKKSLLQGMGGSRAFLKKMRPRSSATNCTSEGEEVVGRKQMEVSRDCHVRDSDI